MIALEQVSLRAGSFEINHLNLHVPRGAYYALMGRTGSGKTTILEAICGLRKVSGGRIRLLDHEVTHLKPAARGLGYVPQDRALFHTMTVWQHLAFALQVRRWPAERVETRVAELANLLGLEALLARLPAGLSGGEAQRVALGRALAFGPRVLLLDEPLAALDQTTRAEMHDLLAGVRKRTELTTLHITHDESEAEKLADRVLILRDGGIHDA